MAWTYSGNPADSDLDEVRYLAGDINIDEQLANDAEIAYAIAKEGNNTGAAARVCEALAALFSREVAIRAGATGELRLELQQKAEAFTARALGLRRAAKAYAAPVCGGISVSDKDNLTADTDRVRPFFKRDMFVGGESTRT